VGAKQLIFTPVIQVDETDSSSRIFQPNKVALFQFLLLPLTTEAMGIWRFAGAFAVVKRQSECGSKDR
jgi:hypothetical protein